MKKKLTIMAMILAVLALVITPTLAFAQDSETASTTRPIKDGLAIVAPRAAAVGQNISMTVFQCSDQTPVSNAGVWALTPEKAESVKAQLSGNTNNNDQAALDAQCENLLDVNGTFLGRTDDTGKIWHAFDEDGRYLLVTFKAGYWPDWRLITIGTPAGSIPRLVIDAPNRAAVGENITITVTEKNNQNPVKEAGVWAITKESIESVKAEITTANTDGDPAAIQAQIESSLNIHGMFLGTTNGAGKLQYAFQNAGGYLLVTYKPGYFPGFKGILVYTTPKVLAIDAPNRAKVDEKITLTVTDKNTQESVKDAGIWAVTREAAVSLKGEIAAARTSGDAATIQAKIESLLNANAIFMGTTNGDGKVHYAFDNAGGYLLVTYKPGYWPGLKPILIINNAP